MRASLPSAGHAATDVQATHIPKTPPLCAHVWCVEQVGVAVNAVHMGTSRLLGFASAVPAFCPHTHAHSPASQVHEAQAASEICVGGRMAGRNVQHEHAVAAAGDCIHGCRLTRASFSCTRHQLRRALRILHGHTHSALHVYTRASGQAAQQCQCFVEAQDFALEMPE